MFQVSKHLSIIFFLSFALSCASKKAPDINSAFEKKYGAEVGRMRAQRFPDSSNSQVNITQSSTDLSDIYQANKSGRDYYAYVDVSRFSDRAPEAHLPNGESYEQMIANNPSNTLPEGMFDISYNTNLYPAFRNSGIEFDEISIPAEDVYGVKTKMSEKSYLMAGNDSLQKVVDKINRERTNYDIQNSRVLIKEQRQLRRQQKIAEVFEGAASVEMAYLEKEREDSSKKEEQKIDN